MDEEVTLTVDLTASPEGPVRPGSKVCVKKEDRGKIQTLKYRRTGPQTEQKLEAGTIITTELL